MAGVPAAAGAAVGVIVSLHVRNVLWLSCYAVIPTTIVQISVLPGGLLEPIICITCITCIICITWRIA